MAAEDWPEIPTDPQSRAYRAGWMLRRLLEIRERHRERDASTENPGSRYFDVDAAIAHQRIKVIVALEEDRLLVTDGPR